MPDHMQRNVEHSSHQAKTVMYIEAPLETIWYYLATPAGMNAYLTDVATIESRGEELTVGDTIRIVIGDLVNEALCVACEKPRLLTLEDHFQPVLPDGTVCDYRIRTSFLLEACENMTKVSVIAEGYDGDDFMQWIRESGEMGWRQSLFNMKNVIELGLDLRNEIFGYPRLGVSNCTATEEKIRQLGLDPSIVRGNYLLEVYPNSPAAKAGLQAGDLVMQIGKTKTATYRQFVQALGAAYGSPQEVKIVYYRQGECCQTTARLSYAAEYTGLFDPTEIPLEQVAKQRQKQVE
ncbi:PDZ domain-containing protein [Brevibacillus humidisoli]|uniref:PDZ domain-containing protein n=1 Tax=Brevibacillus humidisoli TaxID=2895522 RepID=UPI001E5D0E37|nr:PDZ domain-containing protein [Brevibacillus humidisoli]UFJ42401.1 PDZ domain-containing protein [Brevibacillus humidisoli]